MRGSLTLPIAALFSLLANAKEGKHRAAARLTNADVGKHHSKVTLKVFATYWPQWHATPLNDYWFGKGYTDWDLLCLYKKAHGNEMMNPLPPPKGLGWYDLNDKSVRRRQALLAKEYGLHGFAYYHYWFARDESWGRPKSWKEDEPWGADMDETLMKLLDDDDGEPNIPFYFVWANQAFVWKWNTWKEGRVSRLRSNQVQVPQTYPKDSWRSHFDYLLPFFKHPNYHKIDGMPVFGVYIQTPPELDVMYTLFRTWAKEAGLPGLFILQYVWPEKKYAKRTKDEGIDILRNTRYANAVQDFGYQSGFGARRSCSPMTHQRNWSYGLMTSFDSRSRYGEYMDWPWFKQKAPLIEPDAPTDFERGLNMVVNQSLVDAIRLGEKEKMVLVVSFNEWTEQAILEPSDKHGLGFLEALRSTLKYYRQYRHSGPRHAWMQVAGEIPQLTTCAGGGGDGGQLGNRFIFDKVGKLFRAFFSMHPYY